MQQTVTRLSKALTGGRRGSQEEDDDQAEQTQREQPQEGEQEAAAAQQQHHEHQQSATTGYPQEPGIFAVYMQPAEDQSLSEFNEWYNTEHGPARMALPWIHNGYRYKATDAAKPEFLALYDADDMSRFFTDPAYTSLLAHRSERETRLIATGIDTLDRRFYTLLSTHGEVKKAPAKVAMLVDATVDAADVDEVGRWYEEEHIGLLAKIPGWQRSRRFRMFEPPRDDGKVTLLALHEFDSQKNFCGGGHHAARNTPWKRKIKEELSTEWVRRVFMLYHAFETPGSAA